MSNTSPHAAGPVLARLRTVVDAKLAHDRTPRLLAALQEKHDALLRLTARLASANQELEAFSSSVSHDLRAPLRAIEGFSQLLADDLDQQLDAQSRNYLGRIRSAAQRMGQILEDLLRLARAEQTAMQRERLDVSAMASAVAAELAEASPTHRVQFVAQDGLVADADARLLRIVLENLLGNAWKFTGRTPGAVVKFGARTQAGQLTFFVRDNGAGFDMARAGQLFSAFRRLHDPSDFPGTGIGLATARRIIERHGGQIWAEAAPTVGATFLWTLPSEPSVAHAAWLEPSATPHPRQLPPSIPRSF